MIDKLEIGMKVTINKIGIKFFGEMKEYDFVVTELGTEYFEDSSGHVELKGLSNNELIRGMHLPYECFDYYRSNVNNEVYNLVNNQNIKSFQAVLEDGKIIQYSCLN